MTEQSLLDVAVRSQIKRQAPQRSLVPLRPGVALLGVLGLVCSSLEIELLEKLDNLHRYMTYREISLDLGAALLLLMTIGICWWLCVLLLVRITSAASWTKRYRESMLWWLGLGLPLAYFVFDLFGAVKLVLFPQWHPGLLGWLWLGFGTLLICVAGVAVIPVSSLQDFCRTRLAPIGWFHVSLAIVAVIGLWAHGVYLFRDFENPGKSVAASRLPDIYLITIDALRASDMSVYGYNRPTTPNLQRFAERSFTFEYFFANSNLTTPTTTSIETGRLPWSHRVFQLGGFLRGSEQAETLGALLQQRGYYTAMISSNFFASPFHRRTQASYDAVEFPQPQNVTGKWLRYTNLAGLNTLYTLSGPLLKRLSGFMLCLDILFEKNVYPSPPRAVFQRARGLEERPDIEQPRFTWMHIYPPHDPYLPPEPFRNMFLPSNGLTTAYEFVKVENTNLPAGVSAVELRARYDEMVAYADCEVGAFLDWLNQSGRLDRSLVIISADHGESFEHGWYFHAGPYLYNGLIRVPLLIHLPGQGRSERITQIANQADLLPTIMDLIGKSGPTWTDGISLKPAMEGHVLPERYVFSMNLEPNRAFSAISKGSVAVIDDEFKYVSYLDSHKEELYRYRTDQFEEHDLLGSEPEVARRMRDVLRVKLAEVNQRHMIGR